MQLAISLCSIVVKNEGSVESSDVLTISPLQYTRVRTVLLLLRFWIPSNLFPAAWHGHGGANTEKVLSLV